MPAALRVPGGARGLRLFPLPGTLCTRKTKLNILLLSLGATVCCSLQRHTVEKNARGGPLQPPCSKALVFLLNLKCIPYEGQERKIKKLESVLANAPMQKSKLYSLLFIYLTILKYLLLALTKMKNIGALHSL